MLAGSVQAGSLTDSYSLTDSWTDSWNGQFNGHLKGRVLADGFPHNSLLHDYAGSRSLDAEGELRLNFGARNGGWSLEADYQLFATYGDSVEYSRELPAAGGLMGVGLPNDDRRLFNLTDVLSDSGRFAALQRLDRLWVGYAGDKTVLRLGRQAITWGNGFFFSPMDIVNPFDPTAVDTEYKSGDDMVYGQYLRDNGHDIQSAVVFRRNPITGDVESGEGTAAIKYHGIVGDSEFDVLLADNYGDTTLGFGGNRSLGGAVWRGDVVLTENDSSLTVQLVTNIDYSWVWNGKNMSGALEYYYNGFGIKGGEYDAASIAANPDLIERIARGEVYTLGRHYLAAGVTIELTPLWTITPNCFANLEDGSAYLQFVTQNSLGDNLTFLGALNIPVGPDGTEYGGIETGLAPDQYLSTQFGVFTQLAWYF